MKNYMNTVSTLMIDSTDLHMNPGDGILDEMIILRDGVLPYLDSHYTNEQNFHALAQIFRTCSLHVSNYTGDELYNLWREMEELYERKNHDYGDAWEKELDMFGIICMYIRSYEKLNRVITILQHEAEVKEESIIDTLQDICNYCVMTGMWLLKKRDDKTKE